MALVKLLVKVEFIFILFYFFAVVVTFTGQSDVFSKHTHHSPDTFNLRGSVVGDHWPRLSIEGLELRYYLQAADKIQESARKKYSSNIDQAKTSLA